MLPDRILYSAADVTDAVLADAADTLDWFADAPRIDWDEFVDRLVSGRDYDIEDMTSPAVRKIQRYVADLRRSA